MQYFQVTTGDGYILSVQRITEGRSTVSGNMTKKEPVVVQHGVLVVSQRNTSITLFIIFFFGCEVSKV
jgi:hypothetical protein